jgi:Ser/Thr protein kinase RdoA (MazF antagonist)
MPLLERTQPVPTTRDIDKENYLRTHLEQRYRVRVAELTPLDRGVFRVALEDARRWIARVFPTSRPLGQVEGDAVVLRTLERHDFPAERCAVADPVSTLYGRGILVTSYIEGRPATSDERTVQELGAMLGQLHRLPVEDSLKPAEAGALHHYMPGGGGPQQELEAAASWLEALSDQIPAASRALYDSLREQVARADTCRDLPQALIHPDPVLKNVLATSDGGLVWIDWTGAGYGPRLASLALLIWSCALGHAGWSPGQVDAVVAGYRSQVQPTGDELARLAGVMGIRPLVFACWRFRHAVSAGKSPDTTVWWAPDEALIQAVAARACEAFAR